MTVDVKPLEWREDWGGALDEFPEWKAKTPWGSLTVSVAGYRDYDGNPYERHADVPADLKSELISKAEAHYESRILSAIGDDWFSQVVSFFAKHGMLDQRDEYDISDVMAALADNYAPEATKGATHETGIVPCPCTMIEQDETCPVGFPSLLCDDCDGKGHASLLPCPFCGGEAERLDIEEGNNAGGSCICCTVCQASSNVEFGYKENFVSNWNRRAALNAKPEQTEHVDADVLENSASLNTSQTT